MSAKSLPARPNLAHLRHQAKDLLAALKFNDREAIGRLCEFHPKYATESAVSNADGDVLLSDAQLVIAREYGFDDWAKLKVHVVAVTGAIALEETTDGSASVYRSNASRVAWFLENACPDHHVRGGADHMMARDTAMRLLELHPEIAHNSIHTAVVCGDLAEVERILSTRPKAASETSSGASPERDAPGKSGDLFGHLGPKGWDPLLYLCFTRLPLPAINENAVAIARLLLENGADPNTYFMAGDSRYSPLVGVIGEGEEARPAHPQRDALTRLLLRSGANPFDKQVLYNLHFHGDVRWFMELSYAQSFRCAKSEHWNDPEWTMLDMGDYGSGARFFVELAIQRNDPPFAEWILSHGANPNANPPVKPAGKGTLYEEAMRMGCVEIAGLLQKYGALVTPGLFSGAEPPSGPHTPLDKTRLAAMFAVNPAALLIPGPMTAAAERNQVEIVSSLLDLGMSVNIQNLQDAKMRPLHYAARGGALDVAAVLIERGAEVDARESNYNGSPIWMAIWHQKLPMIELLSQHSRDVWALAFLGKLERLKEVLAAEPRRAKLMSDDNTPLMWLPGDDLLATQISQLFLSMGADPSVRNKQGNTAADCASRRGLNNAAALLRLADRKLRGE